VRTPVPAALQRRRARRTTSVMCWLSGGGAKRSSTACSSIERVAQQPDRVVRIDMIRWVDALRLHVLAVLIVALYGSSRSPRPPRAVPGVPAPATPCRRSAPTSDTERAGHPASRRALTSYIGQSVRRQPALARAALTALRSPKQPALAAGYGLSNGGCPWRIYVSRPSGEFSVSVGRGFTAGPGS
jgi:hypothetical protein